MKNIAIVCDVMKSDFLKFAKKKNLNDTDFIFMEQQLHNTPDLMREKLQNEINKIDASGKHGRIILGYGLCSNGVAGLISENNEITIPKVDDCISLFLGSRERYIEEFQKDPATYYLCKGWIEFGGDPYRGYLLWTDKKDKIPQEWLKSMEIYGSKKYDETTARFLAAEMLKNYKRILLINNNDLNKQHRKFVSDMIEFLSEILERKVVLEEVKGSSKFIEKLISCNFDKKNFLSFEPGRKIKQEDFF